MNKWIVAVTCVAAFLFAPPTADAQAKWHPGCHTHKCNDRVNRKLGLVPVAHSASNISPLARCIIRAESGGNPKAVNPNGHYGIGQWDLQTWRAHGGTRYAPTPLGATYAQQERVLVSALDRFGCSAWCPYDRC